MQFEALVLMVEIVIAVELTLQRGGKPLPLVLINLVPAQHSAPSKGSPL